MDLFGFHKEDLEVNNELLLSIPGLSMQYNVISRSEEKDLIESIDASPWLNDLKRRVQHYGYKYDYRARKIDNSFYIGELPEWLVNLRKSFFVKNIINFMPDQAIINEYEPGQGIAPHIDCEPCFGETIITISLGSECVMTFQKEQTKKNKIEILLPRFSLTTMTGICRHNWYHSIASRKTDKFNSRTIKRERRISITFRKVKI